MRWYQLPLLIFVLAFAIGGTFSATYFKPFDNVLAIKSAQKCYETEYTQDSKFDERETFWKKTGCDPTAYFTFWLAGFTGVLAVFTMGLWGVTFGIFRDTKKASKAQLRAYLFIEECFFESITESGFKIALNIKNFGETPAYDIRVSGQARPFSNPKTANFSVKEPSEYNLTLGPGAGYTHMIQRTKVSSIGISAIQAGAEELYVWGCIYYEDCFGETRTTPYRLLQQGPVIGKANRFRVCPEGNKAT